MFTKRYHEHIFADKGADGKVIRTTTLLRIISTEEDPDIQKLNAPRDFDMSAAASDGEPVELIC